MRHRLSVTLPARTVGDLEQDRGGLVVWRPDRTWIAEDQRPRLGLDFLRTPGERRVSSELPAWFENLLPEHGGRLRSRLCAHFGLREGASFALLRKLGTDLPGAVEAHAMQELANGHEGVDPHEGDGDGPSHFSALAGMQLKFTMSMIQDRLTLSARHEGRLWIVKLPGSDYEELAEVETATMRWAARAGFDVPTHRTEPFENLVGLPHWVEGGAPVFAIERFDRRADGSKVHHEDLCQALGFRPAHKNGDANPGVRFDGVLRLVHDTCGENDAREMSRRLGFVIASGNGDAHLKNWSLVWGDRERPSLAPCYDLVATVSWPPFGWLNKGGPRMALRIGTTRRFADLDAKWLAEFAATAGYGWIPEEVIAGVQAAKSALAAVDVAVPERMSSALAEHWRRVPLLRVVGSPW